ncbi:MAG TPA: DUF3300 domain-containing protein [Candidatus Binatia bacterium]|jgi:hypothetical protein
MKKDKKIMKKPLAVLLAVSFLSAPAAGVSPFAAQPAEAQGYGQPQERYDRDNDERFSRQQLENLVAPVALYPDPLLAQILVAATFVDDIEDASRFVRSYRDPRAIDDQPWDVSVKAVAHYPSVIHMMADRIDWTITLGQAYVEQPEDVMASVQFLRWRAHRAGNLVSNPYHEVIVEREYVEIVPVQPEVIFVPVYEPAIIFFQPAAFITFGVGFPIGVWLNRDCDWHRHRVFYHGWRGGGHTWIDRSRPRVRINNVYVNNNFNTIRVNRDVVRRNVNVTNLSRFNSVNRDVRFDNVERRNRARGRDGDPGNFRAGRRDADNPRNDNLRGRPGVAPRTGREDRDRGQENRSSQPLDRGQQARESREENRAEAREQRERGGRQGSPAQQTPDNRSLRTPRDEQSPDGRIDRSQRGRETADQNRAEARERLRQSREQRERGARQENPTDNRSLRGREPAPQAEAPQTRQRFRDERPPQDNPANRSFRGREITPLPRVDRGQQTRENRQPPAIARPPRQQNPAPEVARPAPQGSSQGSSKDARDIGRAPRGTLREDRSVEQNTARGERGEAREKRKAIDNRNRSQGREI